jgi:hypothetical protein
MNAAQAVDRDYLAILESKTAIKGEIVIGAVVGEIEKAPVGRYRGRDYRAPRARFSALTTSTGWHRAMP